MIDLKRIRREYDDILEAILKRGKGDFGLSEINKLEKDRREILQQVEALRTEQNKKSKLIPQYKKEGKDVQELLAELKKLSDEISVQDEKLRAVESVIDEKILYLPNIPHENIPIGKGEEDNVEIRKWGEPRVFDFEPKAHWDIGSDRGFLDSIRGGKVAKSRFTYIVGKAARLERALINYMLDFHTGSGKYKEMNTPVVVNRDSMIGTGQLPKFEDDMFHLEELDMFLIPTAEVSLTNYYRDEILDDDMLPQYVTAYTPCFRKEAGSAGKDTKGIIRQHQFDKIELVKFVREEDSWDEHEDMLRDVEGLLQSLGIPYRVVELCSGDLSFTSAKTYDVEVWMPGFNTYREISSISNFLDFQSRRASLRYRDKSGKVKHLHTLNGSGVAVGRCLAAIMENYQTKDGKVRIPEVLKKYMGGIDEI